MSHNDSFYISYYCFVCLYLYPISLYDTLEVTYKNVYWTKIPIAKINIWIKVKEWGWVKGNTGIIGHEYP